MEERPNALLTNSQRAAIGEEGGEYSRQYRQRIRERTKNGTLDLGLLLEKMEYRDVKQTFGPEHEHLEGLLDLIKEANDTIRDSVSDYEIQELRNEFLQMESGGAHSFRQRGFSNYPSKKPSPPDSTSLFRPINDNLDRILDTLDRVREYQEERLQEIQRIRKKIIELAQNESLSEYVDDIEHISDALNRSSEGIREELEDLEVAIEQIKYEPEDLSIVGDSLSDYFVKHQRPRRPSRELFELRRVHDDIQKTIEEATFAEGMRDHVESALAYYIRVSEVLGAETEELVKDACVRAYKREHPETTVGHVTVGIEAADRNESANAAARKLSAGEQWLETTELRALAETNPRELEALVESSEITEETIRNAVIARLDQIEEGLEIVDLEPKVAGTASVPDMVARDRTGQLVLLEFKRSLADQRRRNAAIKQLRGLIREYGGEENARAILVYPDAQSEPDPDSLDAETDKPDYIDFRAIDIRFS